MPLELKVIGKTDKGLVRKGNEDYLHIDKENQIFAVCDGMGGHKAGEVASMMASEMLDITYKQYNTALQNDQNLNFGKALPVSGDILLKSIRLANRAIYNKASDNPDLHGMGTTIVALAFENNLLSIAHVGDSRAYRIENKKLFPLTSDHSWIAEIQKTQNISEEEASSVVGKNVITRALGVRDNVEVDYRLIKVKRGDKFLLCSDGLCGYADDDEIFASIETAGNNNEKIVDNLIQMANDRGGADNITIIVAEVVDIAESNLPSVEVFTLEAESAELLAAEDSWIDKINDFVLKKNGDTALIESQPQKKSIMLIFALFIIAAAVVIYFATMK
ncbi:MAG TPA: Stp1/IreP family PP2C-type Ser/Thr phosphatase [candidate division Zixibacteria bacterium]|nr:Stp1/IreP family PP2C-type Ser/Thr phosphatase [candidate division Zixibacteria bacterium]